MEKKKKSGAIHQLLDYAGNNKKQLYLSTFLATLGELFGMAPFIAVSLLVAELFNKIATIQNVCILFAVALGGQILKLWPVSYTHLDVYKRQLHSRLPHAGS